MSRVEACFHEMTRSTSNLYLASIMAIDDNTLCANDISLIVNATKELTMYNPVDPDSILLVRVPVHDRCEANLYPCFQPICDLIKANEEAGGRMLVHCMAGRSRSASLCIAYFLWKNQSKTEKCIHHDLISDTQKKRPIVQPNVGFMGQLTKWEDEVRFGKKPDLKPFNDKEKHATAEIYTTIEKIKEKQR